MSRVTDHTRTEKIGSDSTFIFGSPPSRAGNLYDTQHPKTHTQTKTSRHTQIRKPKKRPDQKDKHIRICKTLEFVKSYMASKMEMLMMVVID